MYADAPYRVAKTVLNVATLKNPLAQVVTNRACSVNQNLVDRVVGQTQFGWQGRRPLIPLNKFGGPRNTDMDLFSFLVELQRRQAILELPLYHTKLPRVTYHEERHVGTARFGHINALIAHPELLSFGVQLHDQTIVHTNSETDVESIGTYRTFMMVDYQGVWHEGWKGVRWQQTKQEEAFSSRYLMRPHECMQFLHYVHPHRRQSVFGAPYLLLKLLWMRLDDEIAYCRKQVDDLSAFASDGNDEEEIRTIASIGASDSEMVTTFTMSLQGPCLKGKYSSLERSTASYVVAKQHLKQLEQWRTLVQFMCRCDETAFYHYGRDSDFTPAWVRDTAWVHTPCRDLFKTSAHIVLAPELSLGYRTNVMSQRVKKVVA